MKSIVTQHGRVELMELMDQPVKPGFVLIETKYSAVSAGTELTMRSRDYADPMQLGYSASGIVLETGEGVTGLRTGQRVACYGGPYVMHAERLLVPRNLVVPVPDNVDLREAAFVGLGAIGIQSLRQADLRFGEHVVVIGLGILGQLIGQIADAAAYRTVGYDLLQERAISCGQFGINACSGTMKQLEDIVKHDSSGIGTDAVLICAGGQTQGLIDNGLHLVRDRGTVVIVGNIRTDFERALMFKKEARILISRAGGAGRYDAGYERDGIDYPVGYVRWTEGRNMSEFIRLLEIGKVRVSPLITHEVELHEVERLYQLLDEEPNKAIGVVIRYGQ